MSMNVGFDWADNGGEDDAVVRGAERIARRHGPEHGRKQRPTGRVGGMHCRRQKRWTWGHGRGARLADMKMVVRAIAVGVALAATSVLANGISMTTVGNPGLGGVGYTFQMAEYETTNAQYAAFLNSVDPTGSNTLGIYNTGMSTDATNGGINKVGSGTPYVVKSGFENKPVNYVNWYSAARFVNWLTNGASPTSDTEVGTYNVANPAAGRLQGGYVLPSQAEWYKAAFFNGAGFNMWPTDAVTAPTPTVVNVTDPNTANYGGNAITTGPLTVGSYTQTTSPYGSFDMMGNVVEMTDTLSSGATRAQIMGASFATLLSDASQFNSAASAQTRFLTTASPSLGFRVAVAPVPEPGTIGLAIMGGVAMVGAGWMKRRRGGRAAGAAASAA